jgi:eukaryotic-like serine/threonine-protein kinase
MADSSYSREFLDLQAATAGRYTLERELGRGGMGIVFLARDAALDRPVAIKLLPPYLAAQASVRERFLQEARVVARLSHPNIVTVFAVEEHGDLVFFVMAYVRGESLAQRVARAGPLPPATATRMIQEVAWGLGYAHANGVIHRDVKPDNILIEQASGRAMIADFGVAYAADANRLTGAGELVGTPHYLSPEQANGNALDGRSDLYSLGATAFFSLTGRPLFDGATPIAVVTKHLNEPPPPLAGIRADLPHQLTRAVDRCLAKNPAARFSSGEELAEALAATGLTEWEVPPPIRHYFRQGRSLALAWVMLVALVLWFWQWVEIPPDPVSRIVAAFLLGMAVVWPLAFLMRTARRALQSGLTFDDVRSGAALEARVLAEETRAVYGGEHPSDLKKTKEDWLRILAGPFGRLVFRVAGLGLHARPAAPRPDSKPVERMMEAGAVRLFNELPTALRVRFENLPEIEDELCCRAEELRGETGSQDELSRVIGALERVRLDLMRLKAGEGSADQVGAALDAAVRVNQETGSRRAVPH